jgi:eukaryotic-like serine/threonine-protein kinase
MQSLTIHHVNELSNSIISYWKLGAQITGGRWYNVYRAAPKSVSADYGYSYVLKLINPALAKDKQVLAIDRLGREVLATEQIVHPNAIRLLDAELDRAPFFLVQPWIEGRSFDQFLATARQISFSKLLWAVRQIAEGLRATHEAGRVHLGLDPSHVLLGKSGRVTLLGWSQSHRAGDQAWLPHDQLQAAWFTAPECFDEKYIAHPSSDIYSLGALIYHAITLQSPFAGSTIDATQRLHHHHVPIDLQFVQTCCPRPLSQLVKEMLIKNPSHRPSLRDVLNRLIALEIEHLTDPTILPL